MDELRPELPERSKKAQVPYCVCLAWSADGSTLYSGACASLAGHSGARGAALAPVEVCTWHLCAPWRGPAQGLLRSLGLRVAELPWSEGDARMCPAHTHVPCPACRTLQATPTA